MNSGQAMTPMKYAEQIGQLQQQAYNPPTVREGLMNQKADLERRLANVNAAIEALDRNPGVEEVMTLIQRTY